MCLLDWKIKNIGYGKIPEDVPSLDCTYIVNVPCMFFLTLEKVMKSFYFDRTMMLDFGIKYKIYT